MEPSFLKETMVPKAVQNVRRKEQNFIYKKIVNFVHKNSTQGGNCWENHHKKGTKNGKARNAIIFALEMSAKRRGEFEGN